MAQYNYISDTGLILVDTSDLQAQVIAEWKGVFGPDLDTDPATPQGAMIAAEVVARDAVMRNNARLANQINPNQAGGIFLDAIWALTGGERQGTTFSVCPGVTVTGVPGQTLPQYSQASVGVGGAIFESLRAVQFGADGTATVDFQAIDTGPIVAPVGDLNTIVTGSLGWETVTNPTQATAGVATEKDAASRLRRRNTLALNSVGLPEAIRSNLFDVAGVTDAWTWENYTAAPVTQQGVTVPARSYYSCVEGGTDRAVAMALLGKKSVGAGWGGTDVFAVQDPSSGQIYNVSFDRPTYVPLYMTITVRPDGSIIDPQGTTKDAVLTWAAGGVADFVGFQIGGTTSPFDIAAAIRRQFPGLRILNCLIGSAPAPTLSADLVADGNQKHSVIAGNINVVLG